MVLHSSEMVAQYVERLAPRDHAVPMMERNN